MKNIFIKLSLIGGGMATLFFVAQTSSSHSISQSNTSIISPTATLNPGLDLLPKIADAKALLKSSPILRFEEKKVGKSLQLVRKQIALAILDIKTGQIQEKRFWVNENDIKNYSKNINLTPTIQDGISVNVKWWNSFNSFLEVSNPDMLVIANKYLLPSISIPDPKERSGGKYTDIVYVPYSDNLATPEVITAGKNYISAKADLAFSELQKKNVQSKAIPSNLAVHIVDKDLIENIMVVEHIDPGAFRISLDNGKYLSDRVLTIIGANQDTAYRYTGSPAGASGIAQFIKSTYDRMVTQYPSAKLIKDFRLGMADHTNAMQAMVLFFDIHKRDLENKITRKSVLDQIGGVSEEMLAASYNGGPNRVIRSVNNYGLAWASGQLNSTLPKIFRAETLGYINKFVGIKSLGIF